MNQLWIEGLPYTVLAIIISLLAILNSIGNFKFKFRMVCKYSRYSLEYSFFNI